MRLPAEGGSGAAEGVVARAAGGGGGRGSAGSVRVGHGRCNVAKCACRAVPAYTCWGRFLLKVVGAAAGGAAGLAAAATALGLSLQGPCTALRPWLRLPRRCWHLLCAGPESRVSAIATPARPTASCSSS